MNNINTGCCRFCKLTLGTEERHKAKNRFGYVICHNCFLVIYSIVGIIAREKINQMNAILNANRQQNDNINKLQEEIKVINSILTKGFIK